MLTVKLVYKLSSVPDDLKWATNTHDTISTHFQGITNNIYGFGRPFFAPSFFLPVHHLSTHISTRPFLFLPVLPPQIFAEIRTSLLFTMLYCNGFKTETLHFSA